MAKNMFFMILSSFLLFSCVQETKEKSYITYSSDDFNESSLDSIGAPYASKGDNDFTKDDSGEDNPSDDGRDDSISDDDSSDDGRDDDNASDDDNTADDGKDDTIGDAPDSGDGGLCSSPSEAVAAANAASGYVYNCQKIKDLYDEDCSGFSHLGCGILMQTYNACLARKSCAEAGKVDETKFAQDLAAASNAVGTVYLFNTPDSNFNKYLGPKDWKVPSDSLDSICIKGRYPGNLAILPSVVVDVYNKYCNCPCESGSDLNPGTR